MHVKIWEAACATCADPNTDLGTAKIQGIDYVGGDMGYNNPVREVLKEVEDVFPGRRIACIISIGAGTQSTIDFRTWTTRGPIFKDNFTDCVQTIVSDSDKAADEMFYDAKRMNIRYFRFSVDQGLDNAGLDRLERLGDVIAYTDV